MQKDAHVWLQHLRDLQGKRVNCFTECANITLNVIIDAAFGGTPLFCTTFYLLMPSFSCFSMFMHSYRRFGCREDERAMGTVHPSIC